MNRIETLPTHERNGLRYRRGHSLPFGASVVEEGIVNFSICSKDAYSAELLLFHSKDAEPFAVLPFPDDFRIGNCFSMIVYDLDVEDLEYGYRFDGPYDPANGYRFDKSKILLDPYAKLISGREVWGETPDPKSVFPHRGKILCDEFDWEEDRPLEGRFSDLVIYEMHVRGFTADPSSKVTERGTFGGIAEKIPYLKELGINCVELMPVFEFDEFEYTRNVGGERLLNYWGYSTLGFYAPKAGYAAEGKAGQAANELKALVKELHKNGIEVILDVVFNHTAEGNEKGKTISYRGIDNKSYYLMTPEGEYINYSGCGNTMNCNAAIVRNHIMDCLRYWVCEYHIDGFRFDLASILSRDPNGQSMMNPPLLEELAHDNILGKTKLIAEAWDAGGLYQVGCFPHWGRWSEWNGKYRDTVRRFLRSEANAGPELLLRILGSPELYQGRTSDASINFITCHDGFTLYDLVSYSEKHNLANGEDNRDGSNDNLSWNCGVEGETTWEEINILRKRQMKNACTLLMMSRGVPMLLSGDEFANSQYGNNNAYCQDNPISWLNWEQLEAEQELFLHFKKMIALRKEYPVLRNNRFFTGYNATGYPEVSFHSTIPWQLDEQNPFLCLGILYVEEGRKYEKTEDTYLYLIMNAHWDARYYELPIIPAGFHWKSYTCSFTPSPTEDTILERGLLLPGRSTAVLIGKKEKI